MISRLVGCRYLQTQLADRIFLRYSYTNLTGFECIQPVNEPSVVLFSTWVTSAVLFSVTTWLFIVLVFPPRVYLFGWTGLRWLLNKIGALITSQVLVCDVYHTIRRYCKAYFPSSTSHPNAYISMKLLTVGPSLLQYIFSSVISPWAV